MPWLIILLSIAAFIVFLFALNIFFIIVFRRRIKRDQKALTIIIATKYKYLEKLFAIYGKITNESNPKIEEALNYFNLVNLEDPASFESRETVNKLTYLRNEMDFITKKNDIFTKHEEFLRAKASVEEMDTVYQKTIANYNSNINGYNYWIRFLPFRLIFLALKISKKDII